MKHDDFTDAVLGAIWESLSKEILGSTEIIDPVADRNSFIDEFDRMTDTSWKYDLVQGRWFIPAIQTQKSSADWLSELLGD